jgi:RNA polymerase sigma factor (sigma-70 family)
MSIAHFFTAERVRLISYARRLIDDAADRDGEDIVQDVALSLFSRTDVLLPIETLSAYVYQSLRNRVIDYLRRRRFVVSLDEPVDDEEGPSFVHLLSDSLADVEEEVTRSELRRSIFEAIERLSDEQKAVVIETELNGRSFRELSEEWGIPVGTLLARKSRALAKCRESLRELRTGGRYDTKPH